jgi:parallel beta-helix repeat protein
MAELSSERDEEGKGEHNMRRAVLGVLSLMLVMRPLGAEEARIPLGQPATITHPGYYVVTQGIEVTSGSAITINADNVTLDLNGFHLYSGDTSASVIQIADGHKDVIVQNGFIILGGHAVSYVSTTSRTRITLKDLQTSFQNSDSVFIQDAEHVDVLHCRIAQPSGDGIRIDGYSDTFTGLLSDNAILNPAGRGIILFDLHDGAVTGNQVLNPGAGSEGIRLSGVSSAGGGNLVKGNTISGSGASAVTGIFIDASSTHNLITNNIVHGASARGMFIFSSENRIVQNVMGGNTGDGISVAGSRNLLDDNVVEANTACGIDFLNTNAHAWSNNMLRGNAVGQEVCNGAGGNTNAGGNICDAGFCP